MGLPSRTSRRGSSRTIALKGDEAGGVTGSRRRVAHGGGHGRAGMLLAASDERRLRATPSGTGRAWSVIDPGFVVSRTTLAGRADHYPGCSELLARELVSRAKVAAHLVGVGASGGSRGALTEYGTVAVSSRIEGQPSRQRTGSMNVSRPMLVRSGPYGGTPRKTDHHSPWASERNRRDRWT